MTHPTGYLANAYPQNCWEAAPLQGDLWNASTQSQAQKAYVYTGCSPCYACLPYSARILASIPRIL